jgi:hypothetical protein
MTAWSYGPEMPPEEFCSSRVPHMAGWYMESYDGNPLPGEGLHMYKWVYSGRDGGDNPWEALREALTLAGHTVVGT